MYELYKNKCFKALVKLTLMQYDVCYYFTKTNLPIWGQYHVTFILRMHFDFEQMEYNLTH